LKACRIFLGLLAISSAAPDRGRRDCFPLHGSPPATQGAARPLALQPAGSAVLEVEASWRGSVKQLFTGSRPPPSASDALQWKDELAILRGPTKPQTMNKPSQQGTEEQ